MAGAVVDGLGLAPDGGVPVIEGLAGVVSAGAAGAVAVLAGGAEVGLPVPTGGLAVVVLADGADSFGTDSFTAGVI